MLGNNYRLTAFASGCGDSILIGVHESGGDQRPLPSRQDKEDDETPDFVPAIRQARGNDHLDVLGKAGGALAESRLTRLTRDRIYLYPTWHSQPDYSAVMSGRDDRAITAHAEKNAPELRPTLMIIVAEGDIQAHLRLM
ncbi:hypothetical protein VQ044_14100 [Aurantimonas sp. C2-5-R2]|uniref:hypothetical protein n=1 Tax=Aurantimonas sp. C2-5-R2 TaxID=3113713 RepID=UPI002F94545B